MKILYPNTLVFPNSPTAFWWCIYLHFLLCSYAAVAQAPSVVSTSPGRNAKAVRRPSAISVNFSQVIDATTVSQATMRAFSAQSGGRLTATYSGGGTSAIAFAAAQGFKPGETIATTITAGIRSVAGVALARSEVFQFTTDAAPATGTFTGGIYDAQSGTNPAGVVAADFNNDGILDMAAGDRGGTIGVGIGTGSGQFTGIVNHGFGGTHPSIVAADINGDGRMDILAPRVLASSDVDILVNNGTGTAYGFTSRQASVDADPRQVVIADIDGDGDQDLLAACYSGTVAVRFNNGLGVFSGSTSVPVASAYGIAAGDVDNDGDIDFVATNYVAGQVAVYRNNGAGTFSAGPTIGVGDGPIRVCLGDVNGDGYLDALTANITSGTVSVALNSGTGTFLVPTTVGARNAADVILGDVDGDGDLDLMASDYSYGVGVWLRFNNGQGVFSGSGSISIAANSQASNAYPFGIALADLDNNGTLDLLASTYGGLVSSRLNDFAPAVLTSSVPAVCSGTNSGSLALSRAYGTVVKYQANTGGGFQDVPGTNTGTTLAFNNRTATTTYRAVLLTPEGNTVFSGPATVTVNPLPIAAIAANGPTTFCQGGSVRLTASGGTAYLWSTGATTAAITVTASGTYSVAATSSAGCTATAATPVVVNPVGTATVVYTGNPFCRNSGAIPLPSIAGTTAGTFTASAGLALNAGTGAIDLGASQPGTYTISYIFGSLCPRTTTTLVTVTAPVAAAFAYPAASYCTCAPVAAAPVLAAGARAGTFSSSIGLAIAPATGTINVALSTPGTYTVTNSVAAANGCPAVLATAQVRIESTITATVSAVAGLAFTVFPNPTFDGRLTVDLTTYKHAVELTIYTTIGQQVYFQRIPESLAIAGRVSLSLPQLMAGAYIMQVRTAGSLDRVRFVCGEKTR